MQEINLPFAKDLFLQVTMIQILKSENVHASVPIKVASFSCFHGLSIINNILVYFQPL